MFQRTLLMFPHNYSRNLLRKSHAGYNFFVRHAHGFVLSNSLLYLCLFMCVTEGSTVLSLLLKRKRLSSINVKVIQLLALQSWQVTHVLYMEMFTGELVLKSDNVMTYTDLVKIQD